MHHNETCTKEELALLDRAGDGILAHDSFGEEGVGIMIFLNPGTALLFLLG